MVPHEVTRQAGLGVVIYAEDGQKIAELCEYLGSTTNNIAEYKALIRGLKKPSAGGNRS